MQSDNQLFVFTQNKMDVKPLDEVDSSFVVPFWGVDTVMKHLNVGAQ